MIPLPAMHIPDGFLSVPVSAVGWLILFGVLIMALRQTRETLGDRQIPLLGILAAFVFAAQMINFPVAGGTSGHLLGGALVAILVGPWAAALVMTSVIAVQALLFQDGGLLVLGFNVTNMGLIAAFVGYGIYTVAQNILGRTRTAQLIGTALAAWVSVMMAAAATSLELAISNTVSLDIVMPAMLGVHALIGIGETLITVSALAFIHRTRPDLIRESETRPAQGARWIAIGLAIAIGITLLSPLANPNPDGLERVAEDHDFIETAQDAPYTILPDYTVPFVSNEAASTIAAGIIGVLCVAGFSYASARVVHHRRENDSTSLS